jgi:RNA 2',3'-cyclic 3'-phosphodiesterase
VSSPPRHDPPRPDRPPTATPARAASSSPRPLRLFVAAELAPSAVRALVAFRDAVADPDVWRPVPPESLHVTLAFMGPRDLSAVPAAAEVVRDAVAAAGGGAPRLALAGALLLPPRRARVLCADVEDLDGALGSLQERVSSGLAAAGLYTPESRPFRAHVTVARLRPRARAPRSVDAAPEPVAFRASAVTLFASRLHPQGARYEALARAAFPA